MNRNTREPRTLVPMSVAIFVIACVLFLLAKFWLFYTP